MVEIQLNPIIVPSLISLLILLWSIKRCLSKAAAADVNKILPPSPPKLPIIGNLHQLGSLPHLNLHSLSQKHGPLMLLHFGTVPVLIVSSADAAREIMKTHDLAFTNRPSYKVYNKLGYNGKATAVAPYGEYWRQMKTIFVHELLSNKMVKAFHSIREEETALLMKKIRESSGAVNLSEMFDELTNDVICRSAFGRKLTESEDGKKFLVVLSEFMELLGIISIGDFVPWLSWVDRVSGLDKRLDKVAKEVDDFFEALIQEREQSTSTDDGDAGNNFLDILFQIYNGTNDHPSSIDRDSIKALIMDAYGGGTDTISTALEWAMTELLRNPRMMEKLQKEVREIVKNKQNITNDDTEKMHYLKAVIKETFRCHPPVPLLVPRVAGKYVQIKGYNVSAGTVVIINDWSIGRDPLSWDDPEKFRPERFLNSSRDFRGQNFELIPFGSGRRGCPGITYADVTIEFVLANLVQKFNWELPNGVEAQDLDITEKHGITVHRLVPLLAAASQN